MELKDSHQNQAYPADLQDRICEGASNIYIGILNIQVCFTVQSDP